MALPTKSTGDDVPGAAGIFEPGVATTHLLAHVTETERDRPERLSPMIAGLVIVSISAGLWWLIARMVW